MLNYSIKLRYLILYLGLLSPFIQSDNFEYNSFNNHGVVGLINMPSARIYNEASFGITLYDGEPDQKITFTSSPYDWLEASFFYTNLQGTPYGAGFDGDYKDKGFNFKIRLKEEGVFPAVAIGINDIAGTGYYSSEYIVGSYGFKNIDLHFGLGWGTLNGSKDTIKNPLGYLSNKFFYRPTNVEGRGGQFQPSRYFSGKDVSPFFGISYAFNNKIHFNIETDSTVTPNKNNIIEDPIFGFILAPGFINYDRPTSKISFGLNYQINKNFSIGFSQERGNHYTFKFIYKNNPLQSSKAYKYKSAKVNSEDNKYIKLRKNLENNGIGINKIIETPSFIGLELTQFSHQNLDIIEEIISTASLDSGITKDIKKDFRIANLQAISEYDKSLERNSELIYERRRVSNFYTDTKLTLRPFLASREEFFKGAVLLENNSEYIISDNFFFTTNLKYSLADNFDDLRFPPVDTYPAQVRSDVKQYLKNFDEGVIIGRAQFDYHITPKKNNHLMFSLGILEEMFSGYGLEYLYFNNNKNYALGFEIFNVKKRDYNMRFGTLDYKNTTGSINFFYKNYDIIPFDAKISYGEYLAGDRGTTFEISRSFINGTKFGVFATFTDVSTEQFGEGTFDKGIFFNIPIYKNIVNYTWRPLTKDPGAKLVRKHTLHDLLVKFRPYNSKN